MKWDNWTINSAGAINVSVFLPTPLPPVVLPPIIAVLVGKKFAAFYGTRRFVIAFTRVHSVCTLRQIVLEWRLPKRTPRIARDPRLAARRSVDTFL